MALKKGIPFDNVNAIVLFVEDVPPSEYNGKVRDGYFRVQLILEGDDDIQKVYFGDDEIQQKADIVAMDLSWGDRVVVSGISKSGKVVALTMIQKEA